MLEPIRSFRQYGSDLYYVEDDGLNELSLAFIRRSPCGTGWVATLRHKVGKSFMNVPMVTVFYRLRHAKRDVIEAVKLLPA